MKKNLVIVIIVIIILVVAVIVGIKFASNKDNSTSKNVEGTLEEIMTKLYDGIPDDQKPYLANTVVTPENVEYYLGTSDIEYKEALASEPLMSSIAHSVVLVRLNSQKDADSVKEKIETNVNPVKWVCVEVDRQNVKVASKGDLVVLIMDNELADKILENFNNL